MKKRTIIFLALLLLAIGNSFGQIVFTSEDQGTHLRQQTEGGTFGVMVPLQNVNYDQFKLEMVPVGDGILLLLGLGGTYLLKKRKDKR
jgi:hypothetical protein